MTHPAISVLCVGVVSPCCTDAPYGPFQLQPGGAWAEALELAAQAQHDAWLVQCTSVEDVDVIIGSAALAQVAQAAAVVVVAPELRPAQTLALVGAGVQDVLVPQAAAQPEWLSRTLRLAVERKRIEIAARRAHATDLGTGLPNRAQLLEHMSHLLALREREPAPMALLVLRIEGLATTQRALGVEAANVLRRKVAVRLRAGLRASDVVASLDTDSFAVLLAWIDSPADGQRVAAKLAASLRQPFAVTGQGLAVAVSVGLSQYPEHGKVADELLRRALAQAGAAAAGRTGFANFVESGAAGAANDEGP